MTGNRSAPRLYHPADGASLSYPSSDKGGGDLDSPTQIDRLVTLFYQRLLVDRAVAPWFNEVARISIEEHLPIISLYWQKMLLGDRQYQRHTMQKHRDLHAARPMGGRQFEAWLGHFHAVVQENFTGPNADRARHIATRVMDNLYHQLG